MKVHLKDSELSTSSQTSNSLDIKDNVPLTVDVNRTTGTHHAKASNGIDDAKVRVMVADYLAAVRRNREGWQAIREAEKKRGWMGRLFPVTHPAVPPPIPMPLPSYIIARARELGLL
jgi:hypothetical protein